MSKRERGVIYKVPNKHWGFIQWKGQSVFVHQSDVQPDSVGRRPLTVGSEVAFDLSPSIDGKAPKAVHVEHLFYDAVDPVTHREVSLLTIWNGTMGFLERESAGDRIALFPEHIENFDKIQSQIVPGIWVSHAVAKKNDKDLWYTISAVIHLPEVQVDAMTVPESEAVIAQPIFTDREKKMSIRELIQKKKSAA